MPSAKIVHVCSNLKELVTKIMPSLYVSNGDFLSCIHFMSMYCMYDYAYRYKILISLFQYH